MTEKSVTYANYLKVDELLSLQVRRSDPVEHDEMLFIIIHQVYELWFKLLLHEVDRLKGDFSRNEIWGAVATLQRCRTVMKTLVGQLDVLETMTPTSFTSFRSRLESASGFQSVQFRELEFVLGYKRPDMLRHHEEHSAAFDVLSRRLGEASVVDHFYDFLEAHGCAVPEALRRKDVKTATVPHPKIQEALLWLYREEPDTVVLLELMADLDEGIQEWRYRHVMMVERTIGRSPGTGGSTGVDFLRSTLFKPISPDLWAIRHRL